MAKRIVWLVAGVVLAASLGAVPPPAPPVGQANQQALQQARLVAQQTAVVDAVRTVNGACSGAMTQFMPRMMYATSLNVPGTSQHAFAGFKTAPMSVGTTIPGATVRATVMVEKSAGPASVWLRVGYGNFVEVASAQGGGAGVTGPVQLVTKPFTLEPGKQYIAVVGIEVQFAGSSEMIGYGVGKLTEIKWEF